MADTYGERDALLKLIGFASYAAYRASALWASIKKAKLATIENKDKCQLCLRQAKLIFHHTSYILEVLQGKRLDLLAHICQNCHRRIEFCGNGRKRTLKESQAIYHKMAQPGSVDRKQKERYKQDRSLRRACVSCGKWRGKGSKLCRPCQRNMTSEQRLPFVILPPLPMCDGNGCKSQAKKGRRYCSVHEMFPNLPYKVYCQFRKRVGRRECISGEALRLRMLELIGGKVPGYILPQHFLKFLSQ